MVSLERAASEFDSIVSLESSDESISLEEPMPGRVRTDPGTGVPAL